MLARLGNVERQLAFRFAAGIETFVPDGDVETLDFLDEHQDRARGRSYFGSLVTLKSFGPLVQQPKLLSV
ncbi:MAG TPA: hypothetical protein VJ375_10080 [Gaiellaceae bacterium]|nr:hypothetical protein [Gaiellaceae bacterium]